MTDRRAVSSEPPHRTSGVLVEDDVSVRVVTIDRPERRNAVDSVAAEALLDAFVEFDVDESLAVAVLTGSGGYFCAGADLHALADGDRRPVTDDGPVRWARHDCCCRSPSSPPSKVLPWPAVWSWRCGATCGSPRRRGARRVLPPLRRATRRSWNDQPAAPDRSQPGDGPVADRARHRRRRSRAHRPRQSRRAPRRGANGSLRAGAGTGGAAPAVHAQRSIVGDRAVGPRPRSGDTQRGAPRPSDDRKWGDAGRSPRFAAGAGRHGANADSAGRGGER